MVTLLPKNGNAFFKKEKTFLLIFTCSKSPKKALEEGTKSVKFNTKRTNQYYQYHIKNKAPFGAPLSLHWRSKSLVRSAIEICLLHFLSANWLSWGQLYSLLWRGQPHSADVNLCLFINFQFQGHKEPGNIFLIWSTSILSICIDSSLIIVIFHIFCLGLLSLTWNRLMSERFALFVI